MFLLKKKKKMSGIIEKIKQWEMMEQKLNTFLEQVVEKDLDGVLNKIKRYVEHIDELEDKIKDWEDNYGKYEQTEQDTMFFEKVSKLPSNTCNQIIKKMYMVGERIAEKLGYTLVDVEENDGMTFIRLRNRSGYSASLWCDHGNAQTDQFNFTQKQKNMIEYELECYAYLEEMYRELIFKNDE